MNEINLFVPGRLCLLGEHSDTVSVHRQCQHSQLRPKVEKGAAIVIGLNQGIYATAAKSNHFVVIDGDKYIDYEMDPHTLYQRAAAGGYFSYVCGVASYMLDNYNVGGVTIKVTKMDLQQKIGLSSSAAICVLTARAFNQIYNLGMTIEQEMEAAWKGERRTPSKCGRLDQACAYGTKPIYMEFDGYDVKTEVIPLGGKFHFVIANLMGSKDTVKILTALNNCYPYAENEQQERVHEMLGKDNQKLVKEAIHYLKAGDAEALGHCLHEWQVFFDEKVGPICSEFKAPILHETLSDPNIQRWVYGGKGVGAQGDGSVQFLAKDEKSVEELQEYLKIRGMPSYTLFI